jgi:hypothetical protein
MISLCSLFCNWSTASCKPSSPQGATECFLSQFPVRSCIFKIISRCCRILSRLTATFIFPSITCFRLQFLHKMWPIQLAFLFFIVSRIFLSSLTLCNTFSFLTRSVQIIFLILLQHPIPKLSRYFRSTFRSVQVPAPYKAMLQMQHFNTLLHYFLP